MFVDAVYLSEKVVCKRLTEINEKKDMRSK